MIIKNHKTLYIFVQVSNNDKNLFKLYLKVQTLVKKILDFKIAIKANGKKQI